MAFVQELNSSMTQEELHPSPLTKLPSSHCSQINVLKLNSTNPLPHVYVRPAVSWQLKHEAVLVTPESHCS